MSDLPPLPTLPKPLLDLIGEYGMARTDKAIPPEVTHRWLLVIDGIKGYATAYARAAVAQERERCAVIAEKLGGPVKWASENSDRYHIQDEWARRIAAAIRSDPPGGKEAA